MKSWLDYEDRFKKLAPRLPHSTIDMQTGAAGEHWSVRAMFDDRAAGQEFETLCTIAGKRAVEVLKKTSSYSEILDHEDSKIVWFKLLKERSRNFQAGVSGYETYDDGSKGWIYTGSISDIANGCANLCLWLEAIPQSGSHGTRPSMRTTASN